ncbi:MAG: hypothetical protein JO019_03690 [Candidatus Kaiserbacteria bacterium]|nr:hypothetical protein [Candidatus Kaiserbacteria bacterium]
MLATTGESTGPQVVRPLRLATVTIGLHRTVDEYKKLLKRSGCVLNTDHVEAVLRAAESSFAASKVRVDIYRICGWAVGVEEPLKDEVLFERFRAAQFEDCTVDAALAFRAEYRDQPPREKLPVAMRPIEPFAGARFILDVNHGNNQRRLDVRLADRTYSPQEDFIAMRTLAA